MQADFIQTGMLLLRDDRKIFKNLGNLFFFIFQGRFEAREASQSLWGPSCMNMSPNGAIWTCFGSISMISLPNLVFSNVNNLCICYKETVYLLYKDHTVSVWPYHNSENPYHPSTATCLMIRDLEAPGRAGHQRHHVD